MLFLVRHGRTEANARNLLQGRLDPPLDATGHRQAEAMAERIGAVDEVIASPLVRAQETARYFAAMSDVEIRTEDRWVELAYGEYEGVPVGEVPPEVWQSWRTNEEFATPGGESFGALNARVRAACEELLERLEGRDIVVVSHVSPIKSAVSWALGTSMEIMFNCHLSQASLCRIDVGRFGPVLHSFNEQALAADGLHA